MKYWIPLLVVFVLVIVYVMYFNLDVGAPCSYDMQCKNSACGRATAADDAITTCCSSGAKAMFGLFDYCTNMPNRAVCWSDAQCASGHCSGNYGGFTKGYCSGDFAPGDPCEWNDDCGNKACGRPTAALEDDEKLICCPSGKEEYANVNFKSYCTGMKDGDVCIEDAQCAGGSCRGNSTGFARGHCTGSRKAGEACEWDSDCTNGACGRPTAADNAGQICCLSGESEPYGGFDYCTQMKSGSVCWSDAQCVGGYCSGNNGGITKGVCGGDKATGAACDSNGECANKACGRQTADEGAVTTCCPSGKVATYAFYDYCLGMPSGSTCWSDAQCASDYCGGNWGGFKRGKCR